MVSSERVFDLFDEEVSSMPAVFFWILFCLGTAVFPLAAPAEKPTPEMEFVQIPAGTFLMGSTDTEPGSRVDETLHPVAITHPFALAKTEVTQRQWQGIMGTAPSYLDGCPDCPVENVSWLDAIDFCNELSRHHGLTPVYTRIDSSVTWNYQANGFRLPTEAEWEYACRAATTTPFHSGPCITTAEANFNGYLPLTDCPEGLWRNQIVTVAGFPPNAWGLYDMHGNVNEWCWDWHGEYSANQVTDPTGPAEGVKRVIRGGSFGEGAALCRSASRKFSYRSRKSGHMGFRVARSMD
jgi:formylglycine-generating enzyme required for sulfatase activity